MYLLKNIYRLHESVSFQSGNPFQVGRVKRRLYSTLSYIALETVVAITSLPTAVLDLEVVRPRIDGGESKLRYKHNSNLNCNM